MVVSWLFNPRNKHHGEYYGLQTIRSLWVNLFVRAVWEQYALIQTADFLTSVW